LQHWLLCSWDFEVVKGVGSVLGVQCAKGNQQTRQGPKENRHYSERKQEDP
jgi:hypothetical protein